MEFSVFMLIPLQEVTNEKFYKQYPGVLEHNQAIFTVWDGTEIEKWTQYLKDEFLMNFPIYTMNNRVSFSHLKINCELGTREKKKLKVDGTGKDIVLWGIPIYINAYLTLTVQTAVKQVLASW